MIGARLFNGWGKKNPARISDEGTLHVIEHPHPPTEGDTDYHVPVNKYFENNGSIDMTVLGTLINPVIFSIEADQKFDKYIKTLTFRISDTNIDLDKFGGQPPLVNGVDIVYVNSIIGEVPIYEGIRENLDFYRDATEGKGFGQTTNAWKADVSGVGNETYFPEIDLTKRNGIKYGIKLVAGSTDRIEVRIKDDLTAVNVFDIKSHGSIVIR